MDNVSLAIFVSVQIFAIPVVIVTQQGHLVGFSFFFELLEAVLYQDIKSHDSNQHAYYDNARLLRRIC